MEKEREIARMICSNFAIIAFGRERKFALRSFSRATKRYSRLDVSCLTCFFFHAAPFPSRLIFFHATKLLHHAWIYARPPRNRSPKKFVTSIELRRSREIAIAGLFHLPGRWFDGSSALVTGYIEITDNIFADAESIKYKWRIWNRWILASMNSYYWSVNLLSKKQPTK